MRTIIFIFLSFSLICCTDDALADHDKPNVGGGVIKPNEVINKKLFEVINLDYPGLEKAKGLYEQDSHYEAADAMLQYFRTRTNVTNPNLSLINVTASNDDVLKADYALDNYRFFVNNFYEDKPMKKPHSLKKDNTIDWTFEPKDASDEYQKQLHRHQWMVSQGKMYRVTRDEKYIKSWIEVYSNWIEKNPMPEVGTNTTTWWQLQAATRIEAQLELFEYFKHSLNFTPEWFSEFMSNFAQHADFLIKNPFDGAGNIIITEANALAFAGVLFPEFKNASEWMNKGYQTLGEAAATQFLDDGMQYELDLSYHISAIADFYQAMNLAEANKEITQNISADFTTSLHKASQLVMHMTYPNFFNPKKGGYLVPGFNDTRQASWSTSVMTRNFKRYIEMFPNDKELLFMATLGKEGVRPDTKPAIFSTSGYYVLRNGWDAESTMLVHSNNYSDNPVRVWTHNQADNGTFELYHKGRNFFPDTGVYSYYTAGGANTDRIWYRQTKVHNTMTFKGDNVSTTKGRMLKSSTTPDLDVVVTENDGYGATLKHRRYIFFVEESFFVLVDEGIGNGTGAVNLNFNLCEGNDTEVVVDAENNGAYTAFSDGNNMLVRTFSNLTMTTNPFQGKVSYVPGEEALRKSYSVDVSKAASETPRFITVLYPTTAPKTAQVQAEFVNAEFDNSKVAVKLTINGRVYNLSYNL